MTLDAIARPPSLVEKVCAQLARIIRRDQQEDDGSLPTERELSAQLGVSRSVVREATTRLESLGLVEIPHGIGIRAVARLHKPLNGSLELLLPDEEERLRQLNETRLALEPESARLAAGNATAAQADARTIIDMEPFAVIGPPISRPLISKSSIGPLNTRSPTGSAIW